MGRDILTPPPKSSTMLFKNVYKYLLLYHFRREFSYKHLASNESSPVLVQTQNLPAWLSVNVGFSNCLIFITGLNEDGKGGGGRKTYSDKCKKRLFSYKSLTNMYQYPSYHLSLA